MFNTSRSILEINKWPTLDVMIICNKILTFKQSEGEIIEQSWATFKGLRTQCPSHEVPNIIQIYYFYRGFNHVTKRLVDNIVSCSLLKDPYSAELKLLEDVSKMNLEVEKDFILATLMTQMGVLQKKG